MRIGVRGVTVRGPGLSGWAQALRVLRGEEDWVPGPVHLPPPDCLPPNERRRSGAVTRLALLLADEACAQAGLAVSDVRGVFASSNGDGAGMDDILASLSVPDGEVSPTRFHNSVHNAAAGYWTIGHGAITPVVALGCFDWSFGHGLLKAAAECLVERKPVVLVAYDAPIPGPIGRVRVTKDIFGCALVLDAEDAASGLAVLDMSCGVGPGEPEAERQGVYGLIDGNPAAKALPLLAALARGQNRRVALDGASGHLSIEVRPC